MNKLIKITLLIFAISLCNCKEKAQDYNIKNEINKKELNFDIVLKCSEYSYNDDYFVTADYGCIYKQNGNNYGNIIVYLLPKNQLKISDEQIENENIRVNKLSIDEYKKEFKIIVFLIDSKYLNYNKTGDPIYYQNSKYEEQAYLYDDMSNKWVLLDSNSIKNEIDNQNEQIWREKIISTQSIKKIQKDVSNIDDIENLIQTNELKNFSLTKKQSCDLNKDNLEDFILVFKNNAEFESSNEKTKIAPVIVLINDGNGSFTKFENDTIYPNNFNDFYKNLVVKDSYFTIELFNEDPNNYNSNKFITFKYNLNSIVLHKYSEIIDWSNGKTDNSNYSSKNFGVIKFSDFNSNTISDKIND